MLTAEPDVALWDALPMHERFGASPLGIVANRAAYTAGGPWLAAVLDHLDANRLLLAELLAEHLPGLRHHPPQATYLAWLDCGRSGSPTRPGSSTTPPGWHSPTAPTSGQPAGATSA